MTANSPHDRFRPVPKPPPGFSAVAAQPAPQRAAMVAGSARRAGFWRRFVAALIDHTLIVGLSLPLFAIDAALYYVVGILGGIVYLTVLEGGARGQTIGKRALGIRVVSHAAGAPIGRVRAFIRYVGRYVSSILLLGYLWMLFDREKQTWHDKMAGSIVVRAADASPSGPVVS